MKSDLTGELAPKVTYTVEYNSDVPVDAENTDTFTAITLEYAFRTGRRPEWWIDDRPDLRR